MHEVKLSSKNQIVIPRDVRNALRVNPLNSVNSYGHGSGWFFQRPQSSHISRAGLSWSIILISSGLMP